MSGMETEIVVESGAETEPVAVTSTILKTSIRLILPLSLSFDHRLVDGAEAARFLQWVVAAAQNPLMLSLEG